DRQGPRLGAPRRGGGVAARRPDAARAGGRRGRARRPAPLAAPRRLRRVRRAQGVLARRRGAAQRLEGLRQVRQRRRKRLRGGGGVSWWRAYGKFESDSVKRYEEETELRAYLVVDCSASMGYAGRGVSKLAYAGYLAAGLAYLLLRQKDQAGLIAFADSLRG